MAGEGIAMDQGVTGSSALDFAQTHQITPFEVTIAMFEFPKRRVGGSGVEDVAHW